MLQIRSDQMKVFKDAALRRFEEEMVVHLGEFSPPLFKAIGEEQLRKAIRFGIERADSHGFTFRGPVRLYLELMLLFGSHFDTDPQYPWATEILQNRDGNSQMQRANRLYEKTTDYREKVVGPEDAYTLRALRNISVLARHPLPLSAENFAPAMREQITRVYPQKAVYIGDAGLDALIDEGIDRAKGFHFSTDRANALFVVLMLAFGHGCSEDPLYPWISRTLSDERISDPEARAKRLEQKALTWLDHVLIYFDEETRA